MRFIIITAFVLVACTDEPATGGIEGESHVFEFDLPGYAVTQVDLLFVVDDSPAIAPYRDRIQALARAVEPAIQSQIFGTPDLHVGVTTAAGDGTLRTSPLVTGSFIADIHNNDGSRARNFSGALADAIASLVDAGAQSATDLRPLASIQPALEQPGFFRDGWLLVFTITASDDMSSGAAADYASYLRMFGDHGYTVAASGIYPAGSARLDEFHLALPNRNTHTSIEATAYDGALALLSSYAPLSLASPCLPEPADVDAETPGPQYDCSISMFDDDGVERVLPGCANTPTGECWSFEREPLCEYEEGRPVIVMVRGYAKQYRPHVRGQCLVN